MGLFYMHITCKDTSAVSERQQGEMYRPTALSFNIVWVAPTVSDEGAQPKYVGGCTAKTFRHLKDK